MQDIAIVEDNQNVDDIVVEENIRVDVKGAVKNPGVYELDSNSRVIDAIKLAGGTNSSASTKYLNLSKKVSDEMIIYVYTSNQIKNMNIDEITIPNSVTKIGMWAFKGCPCEENLKKTHAHLFPGNK